MIDRLKELLKLVPDYCIEFFDNMSEQFDVITLCHVIEHVYDPVKVLKACFTLLKPGGVLWLETPNIDSYSYARFQQHWRGLETPRHLVLFNRQALRQAMISAGFRTPQDRSRPGAFAWMFRASFAIERGETVSLPRTLKMQATIAELLAKLFPSRRELLTVTACKPAS